MFIWRRYRPQARESSRVFASFLTQRTFHIVHHIFQTFSSFDIDPREENLHCLSKSREKFLYENCLQFLLGRELSVVAVNKRCLITSCLILSSKFEKQEVLQLFRARLLHFFKAPCHIYTPNNGRKLNHDTVKKMSAPPTSRPTSGLTGTVKSYRFNINLYLHHEQHFQLQWTKTSFRMATYLYIVQFICMIISLSDMVNMCKIQKNSYFQTKSERLIIKQIKEYLTIIPRAHEAEGRMGY